MDGMTEDEKRARKVLIVNGSPRKKGNSAALAESLADGARSAGAEVESFLLQDLDIKPCDACEACRRGKDCHIDDDMQSLYPLIREADALVIAGPVYWFTMTAQTKLFIDRLYGIVRPGDNALEGKRVGILLTYGGEDSFSSGGVNALRTFQDAFRFIRARIVGMVHGSASAPGEIRSNEELMGKAYALGKRLVPGD